MIMKTHIYYHESTPVKACGKGRHGGEKKFTNSYNRRRMGGKAQTGVAL